MPFLSNESLAAMAFDHKYASSGSSLLDGLIMQRFWNYVITLFPLQHDPKAAFHWSAPNTMTLGGLVCMFVPTMILLSYCSDLESIAPPWVYLLNACGIFIYQTLDALDGKQARRTGSSSSFGELFDHGCDAVSTILGALGSIACLQLGKSYLTFALMMSALLSFCCAHVQSYFKGCLTFGIFDVTEIQWTGIGLMLLTAVADKSFWHMKVYNDLPLNAVPAVCTIMISAIAISGNVVVSFTCKRVPYAKTPPLEFWIGLLVFEGIAVTWMSCCMQRMSAGDFVSALWALGFLNAAHACSLIVAHMSQNALGRAAYLRFLPTAACVAASAMQVVEVRQGALACLVINLGIFLHYGISLCYEISTFLGIQIFKVGAPTVKDTRKRSQ